MNQSRPEIVAVNSWLYFPSIRRSVSFNVKKEIQNNSYFLHPSSL